MCLVNATLLREGTPHRVPINEVSESAGLLEAGEPYGHLKNPNTDHGDSSK